MRRGELGGREVAGREGEENLGSDKIISRVCN